MFGKSIKSLSVVLSFGLLHCVGSAFAIDQTMPKKAPIYGPANNKYLDYRHVEVMRVDPGKTLTVRFQVNAYYENAACIYDVRGNKVAERGNYSRSAKPWTYRNNTNRPQWFTVTAWHKAGPPSSKRKWQGSPMWRFEWRDYPGIVGFEDSTFSNPKYDDIVVRYWQN